VHSIRNPLAGYNREPLGYTLPVAEEVLCIVEIPKGSRNKYEWDEERKLILFDRFLSSSVVFPTDDGFVADSLGPDGEDPLDVLVAVSEPTFPGCGVLAKPVAVLELHDQAETESKVLCVPCQDPSWTRRASATGALNPPADRASKRRFQRAIRVRKAGPASAPRSAG
jgi:inorganic pyrophosphatase